MEGSGSSGHNVITKTMEPDRHVTPTYGHLERPVLAKERTNSPQQLFIHSSINIPTAGHSVTRKG
jgi:hypothetical protein